jgi:hypothetical protein
MPRPLPSALLLLTAFLPAQESTPTPVFADLERQYAAAQQRWNADILAARAKQDDAAIAALRTALPELPFVAPMQQGAAAHAGTADAVPFLDWLAFHGGKPAVTRPAVEALLRDHIETPEAGRAASRVINLLREFGREEALRLLDRIVERNPVDQGKAQALFSRASLFVGTRGTGTETERAGALADLKRAKTLNPGKSLGGLIDDAIFGEETLGIGRPAPEISGEDLDGVAFKLSDYRGKVVLLDFWGDW